MNVAASAPRHLQVYRAGPYAAFPKKVNAVAGSAITTMRVEQTSFQDAFPAIPEYALATSLRVGAGRVSVNDGGGWRSATLAAGQLEVKGPGVQRDYDIDAPTELLFVTFDGAEGAALMRQIAGCEVTDFGPLMHGIRPVAPLIPRLMRRIWDEAESGLGNRLQVDCHFTALIAALLDEAGQRPRRASTHERLTGPQVRRVVEMLDDPLAGGLRLADIARQVGLSEYHFIRAFRNTVGLPPHRFQVMLRVQAAKAMLRRSALSMAGVAQHCGFASQSHLGSSFRRWVGMTPSQWRGHG